MGLLRRLLGQQKEAPRGPSGPAPGATPGQLLDYLEERRPAAEERLLGRTRVCPNCQSNYLRVGAWASGGRAGWTLTCVNCGLLLEKTTEIEAG